MKVGRVFYFDSAHYLPSYKGKCESLHGHTYKLEVVVEGEQDKEGMVVDFLELKKTVENVLKEIDHKNLNDIFDNPTTENISKWVFNKLKKRLNVVSVKLWEGHGKWVEITK